MKKEFKIEIDLEKANEGQFVIFRDKKTKKYFANSYPYKDLMGIMPKIDGAEVIKSIKIPVYLHNKLNSSYWNIFMGWHMDERYLKSKKEIVDYLNKRLRISNSKVYSSIRNVMAMKELIEKIDKLK